MPPKAAGNVPYAGGESVQPFVVGAWRDCESHPFSGKRVEKALGEEDFDFLFPQTPIT